MKIIGTTSIENNKTSGITHTVDIKLLDRENGEKAHLVIEYGFSTDSGNTILIISHRVNPPHANIRFTKEQAMLYLKKVLSGNYINSDPDPITNNNKEDYDRIIEQVLRRVKFSYKKNESQFSIMIDDVEGLYKYFKGLEK